MQIVERDTAVIRAGRLRVGMRTVMDSGKGFVIDDDLTEYVPASCLGLHFKTADRRTVCFEPCAFVRVLRK